MSFQKIGDLGNQFQAPARTRWDNLLQDEYQNVILGANIIRDPLSVDSAFPTQIWMAKPNIGIQASTTYVYGDLQPTTDSGGPFRLGAGAWPWTTGYITTLNSVTGNFTTVYTSDGTVQTSDRRLKERIRPLDKGLDFIKKLNPVSYLRKDDETEHTHWGLIAQDVEELTTDGPYRAEGEYLGLNYTELVPALIKAVQELSAEVEALRKGG